MKNEIKNLTSSFKSVQNLVIGENHNGQRLDNFLLTKLKGVPKSRIYRIVRKGEVRVNKGRVSVSYRLVNGDSVRIPPIRLEEKSDLPCYKVKNITNKLNDKIVFEDDNLIVINKPSGLAVHGGSGLSLGVIEALRASRPEGQFLELAHRLDRETSGLLVIAKKRTILRKLHDLLREGGVTKEYIAFVEGDWRGPKLVEAPLLKNQLRSGERIVKVDPNGKPAATKFKALAGCELGTLLSVNLLTGRTHQIRVHTSFMGHPIAGDEKYGNKMFNKQMAEKGLARLFLHAAKLAFKLEGHEKAYSFECPLDAECLEFLEKYKVTL